MATTPGPSIIDLFGSKSGANAPREGGLSYGTPIVAGKKFVPTGNMPGQGYYIDDTSGSSPPAPAPAAPSPFVIGGTSTKPPAASPPAASGGNIFSGGATAPATSGTGSPAIPTGTYAAPKPLTLDASSTVSSQLNSILSKDSPMLQLARTRAAQQANARGLFNTSIGAEAGEVAAIQTALPIAQQDAQTVGQVGQFNAEQTNLFNREQNNFQREGALKTSDQTFQANQEKLNFARQLEQMGYQSKLTQSQLPQQFIAGVSQQAQAGVQAILADPNLKPDAKQNAIKNLVDYSNATLSWAEKFYGIATPDLPGGNASTNTAAPGVVP